MLDGLLLAFALGVPAPLPPASCRTDDVRPVAPDGGERAALRSLLDQERRVAGRTPDPAEVARQFAACWEGLRTGAAPEVRAGERGLLRVCEAADRCRDVPVGRDLGSTAVNVRRALLSASERGGEAHARLSRAAWFAWFQATLRALGRFHAFVSPEDVPRHRSDHDGKTFAVGLDLADDASGGLVARVLDPALAAAGIAPGARVVTLDGRPLGREAWHRRAPFVYVLGLEDAGGVRQVRGEAILVIRPTLRWTLHEGVGYLRIERFAATSLQETRRALRELEWRGARGLVVDLRGNGGGRLSPDLVDCFLKPGLEVAAWRPLAGGDRESWTSTVEHHGLPLAALVDGESASMSEVFAAALRAHGRAPLVGSRTFGKGVGQVEVPIRGGGLALLVHRVYFHPGTDRTWDGEGLEPDIRIDLSPEAQAALEEVLGREVLDLPTQRVVDPALHRAIELLEEPS